MTRLDPLPLPPALVSLLLTSEDVMFVLNGDGEFEYLNGAAAALLPVAVGGLGRPGLRGQRGRLLAAFPDHLREGGGRERGGEEVGRRHVTHSGGVLGHGCTLVPHRQCRQS